MAPDVRAYSMQNVAKISISVAGSPVIESITPRTWLAGQERFFAGFRRQFGFPDTTPADTLVYLVALRGRFTFAGGPAPGRFGKGATGVAVFHAGAGDGLLEGEVGPIAARESRAGRQEVTRG